MKIIKHKPVKIGEWGYINIDECPCGDMYAHYLWIAAPQIKWYYVEGVGSYQGTVYALGKYKSRWFVMKDYYGSCSWCGAWGEGGEPENLKSVLGNGELFTTRKKALDFVLETWAKDSWEAPTDNFIQRLK